MADDKVQYFVMKKDFFYTSMYCS